MTSDEQISVAHIAQNIKESLEFLAELDPAELKALAAAVDDHIKRARDKRCIRVRCGKHEIAEIIMPKGAALRVRQQDGAIIGVRNGDAIGFDPMPPHKIVIYPA